MVITNWKSHHDRRENPPRRLAPAQMRVDVLQGGPPSRHRQSRLPQRVCFSKKEGDSHFVTWRYGFSRSSTRVVCIFCTVWLDHSGITLALTAAMASKPFEPQLYFQSSIGRTHEERVMPDVLSRREIYPDISQDTEGMQKLLQQFSFCVHVVPTNEELMIARHTRTLLFPGARAAG